MSAAIVSPADVRRCFEAALGWVKENEEHFALRHVAGDREQLAALKPFSEFMLAAEILLSLGEETDFARGVLRRGWAMVDEGRFLEDLFIIRPDLIVLSSLYSSFCTAGFRRDALDRLLLEGTRTSAAASIELPHWRRLDVLRAQDKIAGTWSPKPVEGCFFANQPEPWVMSDDVAYAITHDVFYLTDFGQQTDGIGDEETGYLRRWLPVWVRLFSRAPNLDVVAEWLMVDACLAGPPRLDLFAELIAGQREDGLIPSPDGAGAALLEHERTAGEARTEFLSNYHTCIVGLLASALALSRV